MSYLNSKNKPLDPRDTTIDLEKGVVYEMGNRKEEMYHWGAAVTDYCDMPIEEYMKPPVVAIAGSAPVNPDTGSTNPSGSTSGETTPSGSTQDVDNFGYGYIRKTIFDANPQDIENCDTVEIITTTAKSKDVVIDVVPDSEYDPDIDIEDEDEYQAYIDSFKIYIIFLSTRNLEDISLGGDSNISVFSKSTIVLNGKQYYVYTNETNGDEAGYNYNVKFS